MPEVVRHEKTRTFVFDELHKGTATYRELITRNNGSTLKVSEPFYMNELDYEKLGRPKEIRVKDSVEVTTG
jgi:hypothetical protein